MRTESSHAVRLRTWSTRIRDLGSAWLHGGWRAARDIDPDFWRNLQAELQAGQPWLARAVVLVYAAATGLVVVAFTLLAEFASHAFARLSQWGPVGSYLP